MGVSRNADVVSEPSMTTPAWTVRSTSDSPLSTHSTASCRVIDSAVAGAGPVFYTIDHAQGFETIELDQRRQGGQWELLGTYPWDNDGIASVEITSAWPGVVLVDALRFEYLGAVPPAPTIQTSVSTVSPSWNERESTITAHPFPRRFGCWFLAR